VTTSAASFNRKYTWLLLGLIGLIGLGLRLLAWHWREFYPLSGDEQEYLQQALTLLQERQYVELRLMRPPVYPLFLAGSILIVDSLIQNLRLVQALISTASIPLIYLFAREIANWHRAPDDPAGDRPALIAATLTALSYSLAVNATELLTETLFLAGLIPLLWLLVRAGRNGSRRLAFSAGIILGTLALLRSVALPLLPLGMVWFGLSATRTWRRALMQAGSLLLGAALIIGPWSIRNTITYGGLILIDTTGAENLWLDNDPTGREAVKAQLYALGDDRLERQRLASERGIEVILADPARFARKAWGELTKFFALEFFDDLRARPAIWVPPAEVWMRLALGDGLWLLLVSAGSFGLVSRLWRNEQAPGSARSVGARSNATARPARASMVTKGVAWIKRQANPAWIGLPWALYVLLTTVIFHVELRYRLPLYPVLLVYAGIIIGTRHAPHLAHDPENESEHDSARPVALTQRGLWVRTMLATVTVIAVIGMTLTHANYPALAWQLGWKHYYLHQAEQALITGNPNRARDAGQAALAHDDGSALARVALARAALQTGAEDRALDWLDQAIDAIPAHPHAHLLLGDIRRARGELEAARTELAGYESASLQDLQNWSRRRFITPAPAMLDLGNGLDLGFIEGFHLVEPDEAGMRWTTAEATIWLRAPEAATELRLRLASGRPDGSPVSVTVRINDGLPARRDVQAGWDTYILPLPADRAPASELRIQIKAPTFTPRDYDRASPDGRRLGVQVERATLVTPE
jgi:hypothetical protein